MDKENAEKLKQQNEFLNSMKKSMVNMAAQMKNGTIQRMQLAKRLKDEVTAQNPEVPGFQEDYDLSMSLRRRKTMERPRLTRVKLNLRRCRKWQIQAATQAK